MLIIIVGKGSRGEWTWSSSVGTEEGGGGETGGRAGGKVGRGE